MNNKIIEDISNGISNETTVSFVNQFFENITADDKKRIIRKLKEDIKNIRNGRSRKFFLSSYVLIPKIVEFSSFLNKNFYINFHKENKRAYEYLNDISEAEKHGFYQESDFQVGGKYWDSERNKPSMKIPKQSEEMISKWASLSYPNIDENMWDVKFEFAMAQLIVVKD